MTYDCSCDYEPWTFYHAKRVKARKPHVCDECQREIASGERYETASGLWDGNLDTFRTCRRCFDVREFMRASVPCFCWAHGMVLDDALECAREAVRRAGDEMPGFWFQFARKYLTARPRPLPTRDVEA